MPVPHLGDFPNQRWQIFNFGIYKMDSNHPPVNLANSWWSFLWDSINCFEIGPKFRTSYRSNLEISLYNLAHQDLKIEESNQEIRSEHWIISCQDIVDTSQNSHRHLGVKRSDGHSHLMVIDGINKTIMNGKITISKSAIGPGWSHTR